MSRDSVCIKRFDHDDEQLAVLMSQVLCYTYLHDMGGRMTTLSVSLKRLFDAIPRDESIQGHISRVTSSFERCRKLHDYCVGFVKEVPYLSLGNVIESTRRHFAESLEGDEVAMKVYNEATCTVSEQDFSLILNNLVSNSLKSLREISGRKKTIEIASAMEAEQLTLSVHDNGAGISKENMANIWGKFYTTEPKRKGLGLTVVKTVVDLYGGDIEVESEYGKYTRFRVHIPYSKG
jgi:signal transduction histidine kinase